MQHVDMETGDRVWASLKKIGVQYVPGGSAANTITCTSIFGMPSGYIGKIGNDELGKLFKSSMKQYGVKTTMFVGSKSSGRCMVSLPDQTPSVLSPVILGLRWRWFPKNSSRNISKVMTIFI